jgi:hypothetical protein
MLISQSLHFLYQQNGSAEPLLYSAGEESVSESVATCPWHVKARRHLASSCERRSCTHFDCGKKAPLAGILVCCRRATRCNSSRLRKSSANLEMVQGLAPCTHDAALIRRRWRLGLDVFGLSGAPGYFSTGLILDHIMLSHSWRLHLTIECQELRTATHRCLHPGSRIQRSATI